ncbi:MAG: sigma factor-like helix-turn-helix DNA-binding protein [Patescibacteria group bacterium]
MADIKKLIEESLSNISNPRTKEVLVRRFGLRDGARQTLEAIGQDHSITRERVRQIEEGGLASLKNPKILNRFRPVFETIKNHLDEHGELKKEETLFDDLTYVCFPVKEAKRWLGEKSADWERCRSAFYFILTLGEDFKRLPENDHFYAAWLTNKEALKRAQKTVDSLIKHLKNKGQVLLSSDLEAALSQLYPELSVKAIRSYVDVSKHIEKNYLGQFGLTHWPEISPRGVKDKAYIVLKSAGQPLHFSAVTEAINRDLGTGRQAFVQTVHNELIKDKRFVLVGRGLYALAEWGYEPGTVSQIIRDVLKKSGPLTREEIIKQVLAKRLVKENTILINLQNRQSFDRLADGRYAVKK